MNIEMVEEIVHVGGAACAGTFRRPGRLDQQHTIGMLEHVAPLIVPTR